MKMAKPEFVKQIKVADNTYDKLVELGKKGETFDSIVRRCIESHEREQQRSKK
jgi:predicted CopG family antitoxin